MLRTKGDRTRVIVRGADGRRVDQSPASKKGVRIDGRRDVLPRPFSSVAGSSVWTRFSRLGSLYVCPHSPVYRSPLRGVDAGPDPHLTSARYRYAS